MRPKKHETTGSGDLFRAQLDQIINMRHELVQLAGKIDWDFIDGEIAPLYSDSGRPGIFCSSIFTACPTKVRASAGSMTRISSTSLERSSSNTSFRTSEFPHERSDLSHWRKRLGNKLELLLSRSERYLANAEKCQQCADAAYTSGT